MTDNQRNNKNYLTSVEVMGKNKKSFILFALIFGLVFIFLLFKANLQLADIQKGGKRPWYEDEKYTKQEKFDTKTPLVADTFISSRGILMIGANKYEETVTLTKIK